MGGTGSGLADPGLLTAPDCPVLTHWEILSRTLALTECTTSTTKTGHHMVFVVSPALPEVSNQIVSIGSFLLFLWFTVLELK